MKRKNVVLLFCALLITVLALVALSREEMTENVLPEDGILLCEIEGVPYYYDNEYLFKVTSAVFPKEPTVFDKKRAVFYELAYLEMVGADAYVTSDRMEQELKERKLYTTVAEDYLSDPDGDAEITKGYEDYLVLLNVCAEKEGTTTKVFWDDIAPYVEKGILIEMYGSAKLDAFRETQGNMDEYEEYLFADYELLIEKYSVELIDEEWK